MDLSGQKQQVIDEITRINKDFSIVNNAILEALINAIPATGESIIGEMSIENPPPVMSVSFAGWIKLIMIKYNFDQKELSKKINFSQGDLSGVLTSRVKRPIGKRKRESLLGKILEFLKKDML